MYRQLASLRPNSALNLHLRVIIIVLFATLILHRQVLAESTLNQSTLATNFAKGAKAYQQKKYRSAMEQFMPLAINGDARAQTIVALMFKFGEGIEQDLEQAFVWYKKAADQGYAPAQYYTGIMLADGIGTEYDIDAAILWIRKAANQGFTRAQIKLEQLNARSDIHSDNAKALSWSKQWDFKIPTEILFPVSRSPEFAGYRVQLGAMSSKEAAVHLWKLLVEEMPMLFEQKTLIIDELSSAGRKLYRVQLGPFVTGHEAKDFCQQLKSLSSLNTGCLSLQL